jgi:hypothetical protein
MPKYFVVYRVDISLKTSARCSFILTYNVNKDDVKIATKKLLSGL